MSTITTLLNTDSGSVSLGVINTNFDNLNDDKIEATQTIALTNKTIDGDLNTLQDIAYSSIKSTSRSGLDTTLITGTKGSTNELVKWNADGDAVSAGVSTTTTAPTSSSSDTTIPTSQAVYEAISTELLTKELFIPVTKGVDATLSLVGTLPHSQLDSGETAYFVFVCPANYTSLTSMELIIYPDATETLQMDVVVNIGATGEPYNQHSTTCSNETKSVTTDNFTKWELSTLTGSPFTSMTAGDIVSISITSDTTLSRVVGILFKYS
jgi:hypothetical protein